MGVTENYESDLAYFSEQFLESRLQPTQVNVNVERANELYFSDVLLRTELEKFHRLDMQLYRSALDASNLRASLTQPG